MVSRKTTAKCESEIRRSPRFSQNSQKNDNESTGDKRTDSCKQRDPVYKVAKKNEDDDDITQDEEEQEEEETFVCYKQPITSSVWLTEFLDQRIKAGLENMQLTKIGRWFFTLPNYAQIAFLCSLAIILVLLMAVLFHLGFSPPRKTMEKSKISPNSWNLYEQSLKRMLRKYPSQERKSWLTLRTAGRLLFNESFDDNQGPTAPTVVLLASRNDKLIRCFSLDLSAAALDAFGFKVQDPVITVISDDSFERFDVAKTRRHLFDSQFRQKAANFGVSTLIFLEKFPLETISLLHAFTDHENAPVKEAYIILVVHVKKQNYNNENKNDNNNNNNNNNNGDGELTSCESSVRDYLRTIWIRIGYSENKIAALLSRMANFIVCLQREASLEQNC